MVGLVCVRILPGARNPLSSKHEKARAVYQTVRALLLPLAHNLTVHLPLFLRKPLDQDNHGVTHHEVGVLMPVGVIAHADGAVGQIAEHAAAVLPGDGSVPAAAHGVALLRAIEGVRLGGTPPADRGWRCTAAPAG